MHALSDRVLAGDRRALARAASLIENQTETGAELMSILFPHTGRAMTVGITGPPGAGKSTLVGQLTAVLRAQGKAVGILAVDPSSSLSRGAILGDRIRMHAHYNDPGVFIRSMATRGKLGGVAQATLELSMLFDAAGLDITFIETVGVGQDEVDIVSLADLTVVVLVPGLGDDVQAVKAGIMEIADLFVINKSDLPGADRLEQEILFVQGLIEQAEGTTDVAVRRVVATNGNGVTELMADILRLLQIKGPIGRRADVWATRLREMLRDRIFKAIPGKDLDQHAKRVANREQSPRSALDALASKMVRV